MGPKLRLHFFLLAIIISQKVCGAPPELVGDLGAPDRIVFQGQQTYTEKQLRDALRVSPRVIFAAHPRERLQDYLAQIQRQLKQAYLYSGFAHVEIQSKYDDSLNAVVVSIDEKERYVAGKVEINGAKFLREDDIRKYLSQTRPQFVTNYKFTAGDATSKTVTQSQSSDYEPVWVAGDKVSFIEKARKFREEGVHRFFKECGFFNADLNVVVRPENDGTATLVIDIKDEGPPAELVSLEVKGTQNTSESEVLEFLRLATGTQLTSTMADDSRSKLRASARFLKHDVEMLKRSANSNHYGLRITVEEFDDAPSLKEAFSPIQQAALNVAKWLDGLTESKDDLVIEWQMKPIVESPDESDPDKAVPLLRAKAVINFKDEEVIFQFGYSPTADQKNDWTLSTQRKSIKITSAGPQVFCELPLSACRLLLRASIKSIPKNKNGNTTSFQFGMGVESESKRPKRGLQFTCDPVCLLSSISKHPSNWRLEGDRLFLMLQDFIFCFDADTGRLLDGAQVQERNGYRNEVTIKSGSGLYSAILDQHLKNVESWERIQLPDAPISAVVALLALVSPRKMEDGSPRLLDLAHRWKQQERAGLSFGPAGRSEESRSNDDVFSIPPDEKDSAITSLCGSLMFPAINALIPKSSSIRPVIEEYAFASLGFGQHTMTMLDSFLKSSDIGPLGCLLGGDTFGLFYPKLRRIFFDLGQKKLELKDFQRDYQPFLESETLTGRGLEALARLLSICDDEDTEALADLMFLKPGQVRDIILNLLRHFARNKDQSIQKSIPLVLDDLWEPMIKPLLIEQFTEKSKTADVAK